jgi:hypothetical protein
VALCAMFALLGLNSAGARERLLVGSIELRPCQSVHAYCGTLDRPLDPTGAIPGRISIYFEYYPHSGPGKAAGTLVATEGGPGFPATYRATIICPCSSRCRRDTMFY